MKTLIEWLETGLLDGLNEDEYHTIVDLYNQALIQEAAYFISDHTFSGQNDLGQYLAPLIRRTYDELKIIAQNAPDVCFEEIVQYINPAHLGLSLYNRRDLFKMLKIAFINLDVEPILYEMIAKDSAKEYYELYKSLKALGKDKNEKMKFSYPTFRMWNNLQKKQKDNETETITEGAF